MADLFSEYSLRKKKTKDLSQGLYISPEAFIGALILFFLLLIFSFSWGVERGKSIVYREIKSGLHKDLLLSKKTKSQGNLTDNPVHLKKSAQEKIAQKAESSAQPKQGKSPSPVVAPGNYAVQLIVYKSQRYAEKEIQWLVSNKYPFIKEQKNGKITISAGPYPTKDEAKKQMSKLRSRYKDCFVKLLKK